MHRIRLTVGADGSTVQYDREKGGALPGVNITGRLNVDLFKLAKRDLSSVKVKKLENVAEYLGVLRRLLLRDSSYTNTQRQMQSARWASRRRCYHCKLSFLR